MVELGSRRNISVGGDVTGGLVWMDLAELCSVKEQPGVWTRTRSAPQQPSGQAPAVPGHRWVPSGFQSSLSGFTPAWKEDKHGGLLPERGSEAERRGANEGWLPAPRAAAAVPGHLLACACSVPEGTPCLHSGVCRHLSRDPCFLLPPEAYPWQSNTLESRGSASLDVGVENHSLVPRCSLGFAFGLSVAF